MAKINFTQDHYNKMLSMAASMLVHHDIITTKMGTPLNIVELMHATTINTLVDIKKNLSKKIENLEDQDEWIESSITQSDLTKFKNQKELVNLIIGWKRFMLEAASERKRKQELEAKLKELKDSQKTPEDKIKEIEAELASMKEPDFQ
jgi:chromosome segregation ATPase